MLPTSPETKCKQRCKYRVEYEFLVENGYIEAGRYTRTEISELVASLPRDDRDRLDYRLEQRLRELDDLMRTSRQSFEDPHITTDDLVAGVQLANDG